MAGRTYAQINCSLTRSKKLKRLQNHENRWAYICAHLSDFCTFSGMFRYPLIVWADDAGLTLDELREAIADLRDVGLIDYDADEELIRIVGWFHKKNCPENASRMIGSVNDYLATEVDNIDMYLASVAEFLVGCVTRSQSWKPESLDREKMRETLGSFCRQIHQEHGDQFLSFLLQELGHAGNAVRAEFVSLCPPLDYFEKAQNSQSAAHPVDTLPTPCGDTKTKTDTTRDLDREEIEKKTKTKTAQKIELDPSIEGSSIGENVAVLRKAATASLSVRNSPLAKSARGG